MKAVAIVLVALLLLPCPLLAQDADEQPPTTPLLKDQPAPFSGVLVPEGRFIELADYELKAEGLERKLTIQTRLTDELEQVYVHKLEQATAPPAWYETTQFHFWIGVTIGVVVTGLAVWGGYELVKLGRS